MSILDLSKYTCPRCDSSKIHQIFKQHKQFKSAKETTTIDQYTTKVICQNCGKKTNIKQLKIKK